MPVNKVILIGNVGRDPDIKRMPSGTVCASFPLATTERGYKTKAGVEIPEKTEWHNIVAWQGIAERIDRQVTKGSLIYIEGKLRTRSYEDPNGGPKRYVTEVFVDQYEMLRKTIATNSQPEELQDPETPDAV